MNIFKYTLCPFDDPLDRKKQPTPVFLPEKFHGQEEPGGLQSTGIQRVRHNWACTSTSITEWTKDNMHMQQQQQKVINKDYLINHHIIKV